MPLLEWAKPLVIFHEYMFDGSPFENEKKNTTQTQIDILFHSSVWCVRVMRDVMKKKEYLSL